MWIHSKIVDDDFVLSIFSENKTVAIQRFISFNDEGNEDKCLENEVNKRVDDKKARGIIKIIAKVKNISDITKKGLVH